MSLNRIGCIRFTLCKIFQIKSNDRVMVAFFIR